jgi:hypothetical protein
MDRHAALDLSLSFLDRIHFDPSVLGEPVDRPGLVKLKVSLEL